MPYLYGRLSSPETRYTIAKKLLERRKSNTEEIRISTSTIQIDYLFKQKYYIETGFNTQRNGDT
jgi:hypothetical protein